MRSGPPLDCVDLVDLGFSEPELSVDAGAWAEAFSSAPRRVLVEGEVRGYSGSGEGLYFIEDWTLTAPNGNPYGARVSGVGRQTYHNNPSTGGSRGVASR